MLSILSVILYENMILYSDEIISRKYLNASKDYGHFTCNQGFDSRIRRYN